MDSFLGYFSAANRQKFTAKVQIWTCMSPGIGLQMAVFFQCQCQMQVAWGSCVWAQVSENTHLVKGTKVQNCTNSTMLVPIDRALTGLVQQKKYSSKCKRTACLFVFVLFFACWSVGNRAAYYWEGSVSPPLALPFQPTKDPRQTFRHPGILKANISFWGNCKSNVALSCLDVVNSNLW